MAQVRRLWAVPWVLAAALAAGSASCDAPAARLPEAVAPSPEAAAAPAPAPAAAPAPAPVPETAPAPAKPAVIDDTEFYRTLETEGTKLFDSKKTTPMKDLVSQLSRKQCDLAPAAPASRPATAAEVYAQCKAGVVVMGGLYKCDKCGRNHCVLASGFFLTESGIAVTNYHVVNSPKNLTLVAATADGKVYPVKSVLAANQASDVAIVQVDGSGFAPLPVVADAPVGSDVLVLSHPDGRFFTLTRGIVSRYGRAMGDRRGPPVLQITAEYARGSSGAPVLSMAGEVVGVVSSTQSIYYNNDHSRQEDLQMVVNQCVPAEEILKLIHTP